MQLTIEDGVGDIYFARRMTTSSKILQERAYGHLTGARIAPLTVNSDGSIDESQEAHIKLL